MIPEIGHFSLILALTLALTQSAVPLAGVARGIPEWMALARPAAAAQFLLVAVAFGCLAWAFLDNDFSVLNVAANSNSELPAHYRFAATWGSHEGSLLLWVLILNVWTLAVAIFSRGLPEAMVARVLGVMGLISVGFILFMLLTSNPFERLVPAALEGRDLNPLLQDPGMVIHPPMLYMGYVGFSVAFAFAIAALLDGRLDVTWARWSRPWTNAAWCFLTLGIMLGSWWAYYELGWGGWWFWDPVENASFMPWLVGTALIHSLAVTEKRGAFKSWTVLLAISAFSLSLLGTFLVRSGVLTSVHAFAIDPARGVFILLFLTVVIGGSLGLFAWRAPRVGLGGNFALLSRESLLLSNNVLLVVAAASVLLGTLYPLFLDALDLGKISVGPPYFASVFVPLMTPALFLMGIAPFARWKEASARELMTRLKWAFAVSIATALLLPLTTGSWRPWVSLGLALALWIIITAAINLKGRAGPLRGSWARLARQPRSYYGMLLAHCGVAIFIVGVTVVEGYERTRDVRMTAGDSVTLGAYTFRFDGVQAIEGPNYRAARGRFVASSNGEPMAVLYPEKRIYNAQRSSMTEAAVASGLLGDLYIALGEPAGDSAWSVRIYHKPLVTWIWGGCIVMALGGFLALTDLRYRGARRREKTAALAPEASVAALR